MRRGAALVLAAVLVLAACSDEAGNFSQHPGFAEWYAAHPPGLALPSAAERALLERYRPRDSCRPITRVRSTSTATTSRMACCVRRTAR